MEIMDAFKLEKIIITISFIFFLSFFVFVCVHAHTTMFFNKLKALYLYSAHLDE